MSITGAPLAASKSIPRHDLLVNVRELKKYFPLTKGMVFRRTVALIKAVDEVVIIQGCREKFPVPFIHPPDAYFIPAARKRSKAAIVKYRHCAKSRRTTLWRAVKCRERLKTSRKGQT